MRFIAILTNYYKLATCFIMESPQRFAGTSIPNNAIRERYVADIAFHKQVCIFIFSNFFVPTAISSF